MTTIWRKAIRDFWRERTRSVLVVLAIAAGIAGFSAVMSAYAILVRELNDGYLATNPASATLYTDAVNDNMRRAVLAGGDISDAEARRVVNGRLKAGPMEWRNLVLFVVNDYANIRVSTISRQDGAWPPAKGEILIERDAFQVAHAHIGDRVRVKTTDGVEQTLRISGSVHDVGQAQARMENIVYGYITLATLEQLGEEPYLDQLKVLVAKDRYNEVHIRDVAGKAAKRIESGGGTVRRVEIPPPGKHPHAQIMGLLLLSMSTFGLLVLFLSGVLVVNLLTALMAAQMRQIGVMKAIGGTRLQIARLYLAQSLLLGLAATVIAIPIGMWGSRVLCRYQAKFLNFDINSFAVPMWVYALVAVVGIVVPLLAAAYPVWKGTAVTVREALADAGVGADRFGAGLLDRMLLNVSGFTRPVLFAMRNSFRRRMRLVLTVATLATGGVFYMSALNVRASLINTLDGLFASRKSDLAVTLAAIYPLDAVERAVRATPGIARAEGWLASRGEVAGPDGQFIAMAIPPATTMQTFEFVGESAAETAAAWPPHSRSDENLVLINTALAARMPKVKAGDTVAMRIGSKSMPWRIAGIVREPFSPAIAYVSKPRLEQLGGFTGMTNRVMLALDRHDPESLQKVKAALETNLEREHVKALATLTNAESRYGFDQHMLMIYVFLVVMSSIIVGVGGLGLMTTMSVNVLERRREMGVLRAIGATPANVWWIVVAEGAVIGGLSAVIAAIAAWPVSSAIANTMATLLFKSGLDFSFEMRGLAIWLVVSMSLALAASFIPAWHSSRASVREALGYE